MTKQLSLPDHSSHFSEATFWRKLQRYAADAGEEVVQKALELFYAMQAPTTPKWAKTVIIGALAYFVFPADSIPDLIPIAGYTDDLGALATAIATVHMYITDDIRQRAQVTMNRWFGRDIARPENSVTGKVVEAGAVFDR